MGEMMLRVWWSSGNAWGDDVEDVLKQGRVWGDDVEDVLKRGACLGG